MSFDNRSDDQNHPALQNTYSSFSLNTKILLLTIITLAIIIFIVFAFQVYARLMLLSSFQDLSVSSQQTKRGLDTLVIASLPTFVVVVNDDLTSTECPVCLSLFEENDTVRMLPKCKHVFHVACVDTWLTTCSTCPVCRSEVEPSQKLEPEPREGPVGDFAV